MACKIESDDLQSFVVELLVKLDQVASLVMAIRAPGTCDDGENHFAFEAGIFVGDNVSVDIGEAIGEHFVGISHGGVREVVSRLRQALGTSYFRTIGRQDFVAGLGVDFHLQGSIRLRRDLNEAGVEPSK